MHPLMKMVCFGNDIGNIERSYLKEYFGNVMPQCNKLQNIYIVLKRNNGEFENNSL